ncbi:MAG: alkaline phosphatase family protein [Muribaculaceae bacterium]|nr:alkaline phosphatase family protein [Muribaculaceae bacterium]
MNRLLTTVVVGLAGIQGITLAAESRPKLVVGIMVDQLRTDYLENLRDMLSSGGFRRLMESGVYFKDVDFNVPGGDATSASAIVQTGSYPKFNGVTGKMVYDPSSKTLSPVYKDINYIGNFTDETYSPGALRVSTLTDEIAVENKGMGRIHSIAPDAAQAITLAGHVANSAFWVNDETGRWSSTTYYPNPPAALQNKNYNSPLVSRLDTMKWQPLRKGEPYIDIPDQEIKEGFKYTFSRSDRDVFSLYKQSPYVNSDVTQAATEYINDLNLGNGPEGIDVLNLGYTLAPYSATQGDNYEYPLQDAYLRLDKDLEKLFNILDKKVGRENVLIYVVSTGYFAEPPIDNSIYCLPSGSFSVKRSMSLLNAYLSAKYGNGAYVDQYSDRHVYLSKPVLEEKNLDLNEIAKESRDFLMKMSGVADAYTLSDLATPPSKHLDSERLAVDPKISGDIVMDFNPGWTVIDDSRYPPQPQINKSTSYDTPGFIMGPQFAPKVVEETVEAVSIAPTLAKSLRIRAPNSAESKSLKLDLLK